MKIIHCADIHLDSQMTSNLDKNKAKERKFEILRTFLDMITYADDHKVDAIIIAGDLFDTKAISVGTRNSVFTAIATRPNIDFYYIKGNHGGGDRFIESLKEMPDNLHLFDETWKYYEIYKKGDASIIVAGIELSDANADMVYSTLLLEPRNYNIVAMHGQISTYHNNKSADNISLNDLKGKNIDYLALGHVHQYQKGELPPRGEYCYSGCLEGRGFDECDHHGFVLLEIDEDSFEHTTKFIDFSKRNLYEISIDISDCKTNTDIIAKIKEDIKKHECTNKDFVKVVLSGDIDVECEKNTDYLTKQLIDLFYFIKVVDKTKIAVDYNDYELDASLKGEFVRLVKNDATLNDDEKAEIIRCGFQALNGEDIEI